MLSAEDLLQRLVSSRLELNVALIATGGDVTPVQALIELHEAYPFNGVSSALCSSGRWELALELISLMLRQSVTNWNPARVNTRRHENSELVAVPAAVPEAGRHYEQLMFNMLLFIFLPAAVGTPGKHCVNWRRPYFQRQLRGKADMIRCGYRLMPCHCS